MTDRKQLQEYYEQNRKTLINKIKGKLNGPADAEDVVQETFVRALRFWDHFDKNKSLEGWIVGIMYNAMNDFRREERMHGMPVLDEPLFDIEEQHAVRDLAHKAIAKTSGRDKAILTLSFVKGYADKDISDILSVRHDTVRNVLRTFRKNVKNNLHKSGVISV